MTAMLVSACGSSEPEAAPEAAATTAAPTTTARQPVDAAGFMKKLSAGKGDLLSVEPMKQANIICDQLDAGEAPAAVAAATLTRLNTDYAAQGGGGNPILGLAAWDAFKANVLTVNSAIYVCPEHEDAVRASVR
ncbi:hypothetical protein BJI47_03150 [Rhodococcus sp. 1168]|nr:hypothetical protein BJI47_03150 [Rhodococcus sp. 1168]